MREVTVIHVDGHRYAPVASIVSHATSDQEALNEAFHATNSVYNGWYLANDIRVHPRAKNGCRSSMIGDLFTVRRDDNQTVTYRCESVGFSVVETVSMECP